MSTTTETTTPTTEKKANTFQLFDTLIVILLALVTVPLIFFWTLIGFNGANWHPSFWVGLIVPFALGIGAWVMWWVSHPVTKTWPGFVLGLADLIVAPTAIILLIVLPDTQFSFGNFGWGLLDAAIVGALIALLKLYGWITRTLKAKSTVDSASDPK